MLGESQVSEIARSSIEKSEMKSARRNGLSRIGVIEASERTLRWANSRGTGPGFN